MVWKLPVPAYFLTTSYTYIKIVVQTDSFYVENVFSINAIKLKPFSAIFLQTLRTLSWCIKEVKTVLVKIINVIVCWKGALEHVLQILKMWELDALGSLKS